MFKRFKVLLFFVVYSVNCIASPDIDVLDARNRALFVEVKEYTDGLLKNREAIIKKELRELAQNPDEYSATEIHHAIEKAMKVAQSNGLNVKKMRALFELSKKVILRSEFKKYEDNSNKGVTANTFKDWVDWVLVGEEQIARDVANIQSQRVELYKKVHTAFLKALLQKDPAKAYAYFRQYADAVSKIQSADADILTAEAELVVAEQKMVRDISAGIPFVGDALDITAIISGEDLSGHQLSNLEKGVTLVALLTPEILTQVLKRSPRIAKSLGKFVASVQNVPEKVRLKLGKQLAQSSEALQSILSKTTSPEVLKWREFYNQKIRERKALLQMSAEAKEGAYQAVAQKLREPFTRHNPLGSEMASKISQTAVKRDEIIILRPTSADLADRLKEGAYTKGMNVKGKSAHSGIARGYVPRKQKFSKLDKADEIAEFQQKVDASLKTETITIKGKTYTITPQQVSSRPFKITRGGMDLEGVELFAKKGDRSVAVFKTADGRFVDEDLKEYSKDFLQQFDLKKTQVFEVLTDMQGHYVAADIDLLAVGSKKPETIMQNDGLMGNVNVNEMGTVDDLNRSLKSKEYPDRKLVHHGGENRFMNSKSKLDFPLTAYSPDGKVAVLKNEDEAKKYFHMQKLKGYNLDPNPYWGWGAWDPEKGYGYNKIRK